MRHTALEKLQAHLTATPPHVGITHRCAKRPWYKLWQHCFHLLEHVTYNEMVPAPNTHGSFYTPDAECQSMVVRLEQCCHCGRVRVWKRRWSWGTSRLVAELSAAQWDAIKAGASEEPQTGGISE